MFRGTTPKNIFQVDIDCTDAVEIYITYSQFGQNVIEKSIADLNVTENEITVLLTQEDTLLFRPGEVEIQIRVKFADGTAMACDIIQTTAKRILKEGAI